MVSIFLPLFYNTFFIYQLNFTNKKLREIATDSGFFYKTVSLQSQDFTLYLKLYMSSAHDIMAVLCWHQNFSDFMLIVSSVNCLPFSDSGLVLVGYKGSELFRKKFNLFLCDDSHR